MNITELDEEVRRLRERVAVLEAEARTRQEQLWAARADEVRARVSSDQVESARYHWEQSAVEWRARAEKLDTGYRKAVVQIGILRDRMEGCDSLTDDQRRDQRGHELSLFEVPAWIEEHRSILNPLAPRPALPPSEKERG